MLGIAMHCLLVLDCGEDSDQGVAKMAMEAMVKELKESTSSMTSAAQQHFFLQVACRGAKALEIPAAALLDAHGTLREGWERFL